MKEGPRPRSDHDRTERLSTDLEPIDGKAINGISCPAADLSSLTLSAGLSSGSIARGRGLVHHQFWRWLVYRFDDWNVFLLHFVLRRRWNRPPASDQAKHRGNAQSERDPHVRFPWRENHPRT
jgi:hypothetical protein